jgi:hypothetical protein
MNPDERAQQGEIPGMFQCPLLGEKRTFCGLVAMSAYDPKRTWNHCASVVVSGAGRWPDFVIRPL